MQRAIWGVLTEKYPAPVKLHEIADSINTDSDVVPSVRVQICHMRKKLVGMGWRIVTTYSKGYTIQPEKGASNGAAGKP